MTQNTKIGIGIGAVVLAAIVAWLAFGIFGIQTLFIDDEVSEANPFATTEVVGEATTSDAAEPAAAETDAPAAEAAEAATDAAEPAAAAPAAEEAEEAAEVAQEPATPQIVTLGSGMLIDHDHPGTGTANVLTDGTQTFLRFEDDFAIDNGPDLNVYLVRGVDADSDPGLFDDDFVDLGDLKGNIGAQNYEIPPGVDVSEYDTVVIWCVRFGVAFNAADLA